MFTKKWYPDEGYSSKSNSSPKKKLSGSSSRKASKSRRSFFVGRPSPLARPIKPDSFCSSKSSNCSRGVMFSTYSATSFAPIRFLGMARILKLYVIGGFFTSNVSPHCTIRDGLAGIPLSVTRPFLHASAA